ncbi:hypothetical protein NS44R_15140, partial [Mammaliicoccus sciuri]
LVADDHLHPGRLADEAAERLHALARDLAQHRTDTDAADLLVIGDRKMDRRLQVDLDHLRHHSGTDRDKALHVGGAAAVQLSVALDQFKRVVGPVLSRDRHDVGVPRQNQACLVLRADRDPQRGFLPGVIHDSLAADAERSEIALDVIDQWQIAAVADGVERDEVGQ